MVRWLICVFFVCAVFEWCESDVITLSEEPMKSPAEMACIWYKGLKKNIIGVTDGPEYRVLGAKAEVAEYPHMAAIGWRSREGSQRYQFLCAGTLISDRYVLTAAHCKLANHHERRNLARAHPTVVKLGATDLRHPSPVHDIDKIVPHERYAAPNMYYDIALLRLRKDVTISSRVVPACLWADGEVGKAVVTGWGVANTGRMVAPVGSDVLRHVTVDVVHPALCDETLSNHRWALGTSAHQICAGDTSGRGADSCQGDSGSPLQVTADSEMTYVVGVTSFGGGRCGHGPAIYTRVAFFVPWIERIVWPQNTLAEQPSKQADSATNG